jgi:hypothetical protein
VVLGIFVWFSSFCLKVQTILHLKNKLKQITTLDLVSFLQSRTLVASLIFFYFPNFKLANKPLPSAPRKRLVSEDLSN